ncbi:MAG: isochorismatase family protein [Candidatus Andeanibacterium colombiense]|uniref:Isochorismatase family protein n=1 Tax=Candidatus Andeanibacterium colombiense TaxID=3121345 RepID=A0AAJ5X432_9SPHN|nr:MAG: isochorismatase family protein [Sphingomonadaceae bacterium]
MAVTRLDPVSALIVIDLQKGIGAMVAPAILAALVERSRALAEAFRARGLPVVLVNVDALAPGRIEAERRAGNFPPEFVELLEELGAQPGDIRVTKRTWGVFASTDLGTRLTALGVTQVVVTGVSTSAGVESTARQAYESGYNVTVAIDAVADLSDEAHHHSIGHVFPRLGETGTTDEIIALLGKRDG